MIVLVNHLFRSQLLTNVQVQVHVSIKQSCVDQVALLQTPLDDVPVAMLPFQGRLLVGVGRLLRIYDIGKKKMLRKCENKHLPNLVVDIKAVGWRVYVSDVQEAVHFVRYKPVENQLVVFADETGQRFSTSTCVLDYNTVAAADKFGNISIVS